jgi:threonine dehydrogenase-like Zn-dependent dehydrogenase
MEQLVFIGPHRFEWREAPDPVLSSPDAALVRPLAVTTCDLDLAMIHGKTPIAGPFPFGHELVAVVETVGEAVRTVARGDRVVVPLEISCGDCRACRRGRRADCERSNRTFYGLSGVVQNGGGALADRVLVPFADAMLVHAPRAPLALLASTSDNLPDAYRHVAPALAAEPGAPVLVVGGSEGIGLFAAAVAVALGSSRVVYSDASRRRLEVAASLGVEIVDGPRPRIDGDFPITVDASGTVDGLACAIESTARGGVCSSAGVLFDARSPVPMWAMYDRNLTLKTGYAHARTWMPDVLRLVTAGAFDRLASIFQRVRFGDAADALADTRRKVVLVRDDAEDP